MILPENRENSPGFLPGEPVCFVFRPESQKSESIL